MKNLLAACTTALKALGLARGASAPEYSHRGMFSGPRHAVRRSRITKVVAGFTTALLAVGIVAVGTQTASAHDYKVSATCDVLTVKLTSYDAIVAGSPEIPGQPYIAHKDAVYETVVDSPAVAEQSHYVYHYKQRWFGDWVYKDFATQDRWVTFGWTYVDKTKVVDVAAKAAVTHQELVSPEVVGQPFIAHKNAVQAKANTIKVTVDGNVVENTTFGTSFNFGSKDYNLGDKYTSHSYEVKVVGSDGQGSFTKTGKNLTCTPPVKACADGNSLTWTKDATLSTATVSLKPGFTTCDVSLNSYETDGPDWATSGNQQFVDHDHASLTTANPTAKLTVDTRGCFQQQDLYIGTKLFNGTDGALPNYLKNISTPTGLLDHWNGQVGANCVTTVQEASATVSPQLCNANTGVLTSGYITIPATDHVTYSIEGVVKAAGNYPLANGSYTVTVAADSGFKLTGQSSYTLVVVAAGDCLIPVTVTPATSIDNSCDTVATLTLPNIEGVVWTVNGGSIAYGDWPMNAGGPNVVVASAAAGYVLSAPYTESFTFAAALECVTPVVPTASPAVCDTVDGTITGGHITIPVTKGVSYFIDGDAASAGDHDAKVGDHTVTAVADSGYKLLGDASWTVTVTAAGTCLIPAIPGDPEAHDQVCNLDLGGFLSGYITIENTPNVSYTLDGVAAASGNHDVALGAHTVVATANSGYVLSGQSSWNLTVSGVDGSCDLVTHALRSTGVSSTNELCTSGAATNGSITFGQSAGSDFFGKGVTYFVDGVKVTSPVISKPAGTYHVTAVLDDPINDAFDFDALSSWTVTIGAVATVCGDLTTLAFTGVNGNLGGMLMVALFLLLGGAGVYTTSRIRARKN